MRWLTVAEAAKELHRSPDIIRQAIARGDLVAWRPPESNRGTLIHFDDLDNYVRGTYEPAYCPNAARRKNAKSKAVKNAL